MIKNGGCPYLLSVYFAAYLVLKLVINIKLQVVRAFFWRDFPVETESFAGFYFHTGLKTGAIRDAILISGFPPEFMPKVREWQSLSLRARWNRARQSSTNTYIFPFIGWRLLHFVRNDIFLFRRVAATEWTQWVKWMVLLIRSFVFVS